MAHLFLYEMFRLFELNYAAVGGTILIPEYFVIHYGEELNFHYLESGLSLNSVFMVELSSFSIFSIVGKSGFSSSGIALFKSYWAIPIGWVVPP